MVEKKQLLSDHLVELRKRLIISLVALFWGTVFTFFFGREIIFTLLKRPLQELGQELFALTVTAGFFLQIKIALGGGIILATPIILWQIIAFVLPALYRQEKWVFWSIFISSLVLFIGGIVFAYQVVFLLGLRFFLIDFGQGLIPLISVTGYLGYFLAFLFPFGLVFEIPIVAFILTKAKIITPRQLRQKRRYIIIIIFILAALLTPPDVISQILLALPMLVLYEISILVSFFAAKR